MRRAAAVLLTAMLAISLVCCAAPGTGPDEPPSSASETAGLTEGELTICCSDTFLQALRRASEPFKTNHPDVTLRFTSSPQSADLRLIDGFTPVDLSNWLDLTDWYTEHCDLFIDGAQRGKDNRVYGIPFALNGALLWTYSTMQSAADTSPAVCGNAESLLWGAVLPLYVQACENSGRAPTFGPEALDSPEFSDALERTQTLFDEGLLVQGTDVRRGWTGGVPLLDDMCTPSRMKSHVTGPGEWKPTCAALFEDAKTPVLCIASECFFLSANSSHADTALCWLEELYANIDHYYKKADLVLPAAYPLPVQSGTMSTAMNRVYTLMSDPDLSLCFTDLTWSTDQHGELLKQMNAMLSGE